MGGENESRRGEPTAIERYYRLHATIYDATRWSFLFGRTAILKALEALEAPDSKTAPPARILEVGCGTGKNLVRLGRRFPQAEITGVDLSEAMLELARRKIGAFGGRVQLLHRAYDAPMHRDGGYDLILFSYALSMFNPGFAEAIAAAHADLAAGGRIAVVDFHDTRWAGFERWMRMNHVRMNGQLQPGLRARFAPEIDTVRGAYGGAWRYLMFVGKKQAAVFG